MVGAGYTGLAATLELAQAGARVVVLEARQIGHGGSGRNVGLVNAGLWLLPSEVVRNLRPAEGERLLAALQDSPAAVFALIDKHGINCEAVRTGTLQVAHGSGGRRSLEKRVAQWAARGAPVEMLAPADAAQLVGGPAPHGAMLDRRAGTVQPLALVRGMAEAGMAAGARLYTETPVRQLERQGSAWCIEAPEGRVLADRVLVAVNAYGEGRFVDIARNLVSLYYFQFATAPLSANLLATILPERQGVCDTRTVLSSWRVDGSGRLIVGSVGRLDRGGSGVHRLWAERALARLYPTLSVSGFEFGWMGRIGMTGAHVPMITNPAPGLLSVCGYNGRGIGPGVVFGQTLARHLLGGPEADLPVPIRSGKRERLVGLRGLAIEVGARALHYVAKRGRGSGLSHAE